MKQTRNKNFSRRFLSVGIVILSVIFAFGCGGTTAPANGNTAANKTTANTNTATNSNTATNANAVTNTNTATNSNANNSASTPTNANSAATDSAASKKDEKSEEKSDCTVKADNADFFIEATGKTVKLKKGTLINVRSWDMHQGLYAVKAQIDGKWVEGEIQADSIDCPDDGKDEKK